MQDNIYVNLRRAVSLLVNGNPVAFPTDTVYALGAPVNYISCIQKIFDIKRRPMNMPLPILLGEARDIDLVACDISDAARNMMRDFWPGALTIVFRKKPFVPDIVTAGQPTVGVRIANHSTTIDIVKWVDVPLVGTSANIHGLPSPLTAQEVDHQIGDSVNLIIDGGKTPGGIESTIIDMSTDKPRILRHGAVPQEALEKYCILY
ncbi:MAG: L-threonylcarbamoyladenylate synthase [Dehalococcoidia bacterium]|nr:L-threonylcarbamoyladenylate synthase [Dehalococcoidia bacterium]